MTAAFNSIDSNMSSINGSGGADEGSVKEPSWILFVSGPTGSGKSSVAKFLASRLGAHYLEGDDLHPKANIDKMHRGEPLTDEDRQGWFEAINEQASAYNRQQSQHHHLIITCSALKRAHRDILRESCDRAGYSLMHFFFLDAPESVLRQRTEARQNHFAKSNLVHSQFDVLERPRIDEYDATIISVVPPLDEVQSETLKVATELNTKSGYRAS
ncbi:gluconokinase [Trichoderma asperellum]|nr:carbohydrate kinase [Trichoderma asperelloides]